MRRGVVRSWNRTARLVLAVALVARCGIAALSASGAAAPAHRLCTSVIPAVKIRSAVGKSVKLTIYHPINAFNVPGDDGSQCGYEFANQADYYDAQDYYPAVVTAGWGVTAKQFRSWLTYAMTSAHTVGGPISHTKKPLQIGFGSTAVLITEVFEASGTPIPNLYSVEVLTKHKNALEVSLFGTTPAQVIGLARAAAQGM